MCYLVDTVWVGDRWDAFRLWNRKVAAVVTAVTVAATNAAAHAGVSSLLI